MIQHQIGLRADALLEALWNAGGTDLLITTGMTPQLRIHGDLVPVAGAVPLTSEDADDLLEEVLTPDQLATWGQRF